MSQSEHDLEWFDGRIKDRRAAFAAEERASFDPNLSIIDAGTFAQQIANLAETLRIRLNARGRQFFPAQFDDRYRRHP